jgi:hypothetical protein
MDDELPPAPDAVPPVVLTDAERRDMRARLTDSVRVHRVRVGKWNGQYFWACQESDCTEGVDEDGGFDTRAEAAEDAGKHGVVIV